MPFLSCPWHLILHGRLDLGCFQNACLLDSLCWNSFRNFHVNVVTQTLFSFILPVEAPQVYLNYVWFLLDLVIVGQVCWYCFDPHFTTQPLATLRNRTQFTIFTVLLYGFAMWILYSANILGVTAGISAFVMNAIMSLMFCLMLMNRGSTEAQSQWIAITKWIGIHLLTRGSFFFFFFGCFRLANSAQCASPTGSGAYSVVVWIQSEESRQLYTTPFLITVIVMCQVFDLLYIVQLFRYDINHLPLEQNSKSRNPANSTVDVFLECKA